MADPSPPDDDLVAQVYRAHVIEGTRQREVAARFDLAQSTVSDYVRRAREALELRDMFGQVAAQSDSAARLVELWRVVHALIEKADDPLPLVDRLIKIEKSIRELTIPRGPMRIELDDQRKPDAARPDPGLIAALERLDAEHRAEDKHLRAGGQLPDWRDER